MFFCIAHGCSASCFVGGIPEMQQNCCMFDVVSNASAKVWRSNYQATRHCVATTPICVCVIAKLALHENLCVKLNVSLNLVIFVRLIPTEPACACAVSHAASPGQISTGCTHSMYMYTGLDQQRFAPVAWQCRSCIRTKM